MAVLNNYYGREWTILLAKERGGYYKDQYNLCAGKLEPEDHGCYISGAIRELCQEFKISLDYSEFDLHFRTGRISGGTIGKLRYKMMNGTPVFIGHFPSVRIHPLKKKIMHALRHSRDPAEKEMSDIDRFKLADVDQDPNISSFAKGLVKRLVSEDFV